VQWPQLQQKYPKAQYAGRLMWDSPAPKAVSDVEAILSNTQVFERADAIYSCINSTNT
jgi:hypothetical protein